MSKVILEFDGITEQDEYFTALNAYNWRGCVEDLDNKLRERAKYDNPFLDENDISVNQADLIRVMLREIMSENNVKFD